jgi:hypothetical protein
LAAEAGKLNATNAAAANITLLASVICLHSRPVYCYGAD